MTAVVTWQTSRCIITVVHVLFAAVLTNADGSVVDMKVVSFSTIEGCVYCPAGQCDCDVSSTTQIYVIVKPI